MRELKIERKERHDGIERDIRKEMVRERRREK